MAACLNGHDVAEGQGFCGQCGARVAATAGPKKGPFTQRPAAVANATGGRDQKAWRAQQRRGLIVAAVSIVVAVIAVLAFQQVMASSDLTDEIDLQMGQCSSDEITGTLVNNSDETVDVVIRYELIAASGTRVGDGVVLEYDVAPGQRVAWQQPVFDRGFRRCLVNLDSARRS